MFLVVALVVIVAPGPDFALTVRNALRGVVLVALGPRLATGRR